MASIGQELLNVPFPDMVAQLAAAIAEGQYKLDMVSCKIAKIMGDKEQSPVHLPDLTKDGSGDDDPTFVTSLIGAGFQPTFYQFTDTIIEVKIDITMSRETETSVDAGFKCFGTHVNAKYSSKYSYTATGSSLLRTKITPVPPSTFMQKMLEMKAQLIQQQSQVQMKELELKMLLEQAKIDKQMKDLEQKNDEEIEKAEKEQTTQGSAS